MERSCSSAWPKITDVPSAMVVAGTFSQNKKTRRQPNFVCNCSPEILAVWSVFNTKMMTGSVTEIHVDGLSFVKESLSDLGGMVFITKTIQHEYSNDHHWTLPQTRTLNKFHMRTNTSVFTEGCFEEPGKMDNIIFRKVS